MNISIRSLEGQAMQEAFYPLSQYCFRPSPPFEDKEAWMVRVRGRGGLTCRAVFEDETPVTIAVSSAMTQNMRGALYPVSGVWGVATHPSARRQGYVRQVMARLLEAERESGKAFTNLYPFRESFYERMGYVSYPMVKTARFAPKSLAPLLKMDLEGEVELKLTAEAYETYRQYLMETRQEKHGMLLFDYDDKSRHDRVPSWTAFARFGGRVEGMLVYTLGDRVDYRVSFNASDFLYQTPRARYLLLNWIARHIDQADRVELRLPADETPESWLADLGIKVETSGNAPMCRVLDVARIGGMQVGEGDFTARIVDPLCPWNEGDWRFEGRGGRLQVSRTAEAGCQLTIQGLTALVTGTHDPRDFAFRGWGSPDAAAQGVLRAMFPRMTSYMHESF